jgi:aryl-alcohol dehydrogenase-like predicted oxidoreductase
MSKIVCSIDPPPHNYRAVLLRFHRRGGGELVLHINNSKTEDERNALVRNAIEAHAKAHNLSAAHVAIHWLTTETLRTHHTIGTVKPSVHK